MINTEFSGDSSLPNTRLDASFTQESSISETMHGTQHLTEEQQRYATYIRNNFVANQRRILITGGQNHCVIQPPSDQDYISNHVLGKNRLGLSPFMDDKENVRWACFDFDNHGKDAVDNPVAIGLKLRKLLLQNHGWNSLVEITKSGGVHVWIFFKPYALAKKVRAALGHILQSLELPCAEIFPKQDDLLPKNGKETFGNMVNMPYFGGEGGVSEHRTLFVDDSGNPLSDLPTIIMVSCEQVEELYQRIPVEIADCSSVNAGENNGNWPEDAEGYDDLNSVLEGCDFMKHWVESGTAVTESLWEAGISNLLPFSGGAKIIHEASSGYKPKNGTAGYTEEMTNRKIDRSSRPWKCETIKNHGFNDCPEEGCGVNCPADLGRAKNSNLQNTNVAKGQSPQQQKTGNNSSMVMDIIKSMTRGMRDEQGNPYVQFDDESSIWHFTEGVHATNRIQNIAIRETGYPLLDNEFKKTSLFLTAKAWTGPQEELYYRKAIGENEVYIDTGADESFIRIRPDGWDTMKDVPAKFRRTQAMNALILPEEGGTIDLLRQFMNCSDNDYQKIILCVLYYLVGSGPYPILSIKGEQGSAKTTSAKFIISMIDPSAGCIRAFPRNEADLAVAARSRYVLGFDNLSGMSRNMSDALCRIASGGSFSTRKLYTNEDEHIIEFCRPVVLTGIGSLGEGEDLQDRSIYVYMKAIPDHMRRSEEELLAKFNSFQGKILGALLDVAAAGLKRLPEIKLERSPRMADFARFSVACEEALGWKDGTVLDMLFKSRDEAVFDSLNEDPFAQAIIKEAHIANTKRTATEWDNYLRETYRRSHNDTGWPKGPKALSQRLERLAPQLRLCGIEVVRERVEGQKFISLKQKKADKNSPFERL